MEEQNCCLFGDEADNSNVEVAVEIDIEKFWNIIEELYKKY